MKTLYAKSYKMVNGKGEHRLIAEEALGRSLTTNEVVHHINDDKRDNRIENLIVVTRAWHKRIHKDIGATTRFYQIHNLDSKEVFAKYVELGSAERTAVFFGCSGRTILRVLRTTPEYKPWAFTKRRRQYVK